MCSRCRDLVLLAALALGGCRPGSHEVGATPPAEALGPADGGAPVGGIDPGGATAGRNAAANPYLGNAYAMNEGKRLFAQYNCVGCHAHGGGGIGPALMDGAWRYGSAPDQIFATIMQGRPNGMPTFRNKLPDYQVWMLVAYVRSMAGLAPKDSAPGRDEAMNVRPPENLFAPQGERGEATVPLQ